jgi:hypothetical protein
LKNRQLPPGIAERQKKYLEDKATVWAAEDQRTQLSQKDLAQVSERVHTKIGNLEYRTIHCALNLPSEPPPAQRVAWGSQLATSLKAGSNPESSAYFCLDMRVNRLNAHHVIGLKRGKLKTPRHYSLFDANYWEITQINETVLEKFLADISHCLPKKEAYHGLLTHITPKPVSTYDPFAGVEVDEWV